MYEVKFSNATGHGVEMQSVIYGYNYFRRYFETIGTKNIINTFTTADFNGLGIDRVVQSISRTSDSAVIRFYSGDQVIITVTGTRTDVGQWEDTEIEALMDRSLSIYARGVADVMGTKYADLLIAGQDNTSLNGRGGDDTLKGWFGFDTLSGGAGNDTLYGGWEDDVLTGGFGRDRFVFSNNDESDTITDFDVSRDKIVFERVTGRAGVNISERADGVVIDVLAGNTEITLSGLHLDDISGRNIFIFA